MVFAASMVDIESSHTSDYCVVRGRTITGRDLLCVFDALDDVTILPITAYEPQPE